MSQVKETKELAIGLLKLAALLAGAFKDGVQAADIAVVFAKIEGDAALKQALLDAYNGAELIGDEVKAIDAAGFVEILGAALPEVLSLIKAASK